MLCDRAVLVHDFVSVIPTGKSRKTAEGEYAREKKKRYKKEHSDTVATVEGKGERVRG